MPLDRKVRKINEISNINKMTIRSNKYLSSIQSLRGIAALLVVFHHSYRAFLNYEGFENPTFSNIRSFEMFGAVGVDIFFVISGFIMVVVASPYLTRQKNVRDFILRRIIRIYPLYIIMTGILIILAFYMSIGSTVIKILTANFSSISLPNDLLPHRLIGSVLFIPTFNTLGKVQPILGVGWTLFYEMLFYIIFAIGLLLGRKMLLPFLGATLISLLVLFSTGTSSFHVFFSNSITLEFLFGTIIGLFYVQGKNINNKYLIILLGSAISLFLITIFFEFDYDKLRFIYWGIPATLLVYASVNLERNERVSRPSWLLMLGDASYSLYLIHTILISQVIMRIFYYSKITSPATWLTNSIILATSFLCVIASLYAYKYLEKPIHNYLIKRYRSLSVAEGERREPLVEGRRSQG